MNKSKLLPILICAVLAIGLAAVMVIPSCGNTAITPAQVQTVAAQVQNLGTQLSTYQAQVQATTDAMAQAGTIDPNTSARITEFNTKIDKVKTQIASIAAAVQAGTYNSSDDSVLTILKAAQAANAATTPFNPYAGLISIVLGLIVAVLSIVAKQKSDQATLATTTLGAVTKAVEASPDTVQDAIKPAVASNLSAAGISIDGKMLIAQSKAA